MPSERKDRANSNELTLDQKREAIRGGRTPLDGTTPMQNYLRRFANKPEQFHYFALMEGDRITKQDLEDSFYDVVTDAKGQPVTYTSKGEKFHLMQLPIELHNEKMELQKKRVRETVETPVRGDDMPDQLGMKPTNGKFIQINGHSELPS